MTGMLSDRTSIDTAHPPNSIDQIYSRMRNEANISQDVTMGSSAVAQTMDS